MYSCSRNFRQTYAADTGYEKMATGFPSFIGSGFIAV
jgi:hypothetical protein